MMDYGKYKYEQQKKAAEARKRQKVIEIKEIKMRPTIDDHDYDVKMRSMKRFFDEGDKVKVTLRFRGREMAHQNIGMELLTRIQKETDGFAKIEQYPSPPQTGGDTNKGGEKGEKKHSMGGVFMGFPGSRTRGAAYAGFQTPAVG